jgi:hypothetical protein
VAASTRPTTNQVRRQPRPVPHRRQQVLHRQVLHLQVPRQQVHRANPVQHQADHGTHVITVCVHHQSEGESVSVLRYLNSMRALVRQRVPRIGHIAMRNQRFQYATTAAVCVAVSFVYLRVIS